MRLNEAVQEPEIRDLINEAVEAVLKRAGLFVEPDIKPDAANSEPQEVWRTKTVLQKLGISKSQLYQMIRQGVYPPPRKLSPRVSFWFASDWAPVINGAKRGR